MTVRIERIYDPPDGEGYRVLVDRLWPRGVTRQAAAVDLWAKALTPSDELRRWYHRHPDEGDEFTVRYRAELDGADSADVVEDLRHRDELVLVTAVRDPSHSHVPVLQEWLSTRGVGV